jgi:hypothetical protein
LTFEPDRTLSVDSVHDNETAGTDQQRRDAEQRSLPRLFGLGAAACVACCTGPILAVLGAVTAGGILSTRFIGVVGLAVAAAGAIAFLAVRRGRAIACKPSTTQPAVVPSPTRRKK